MKMCSTVSAGRWTCLLAVALLVLLSAVHSADASGPVISCCRKASSKKIHIFQECYEQMPRHNCIHAFLIINKRGRYCIRPDAAWLKAKMATGKLRCPQDLSR